MERLEPVLKQKFWILLGVGILMTIVGWWMATGQMALAITERKAKIKVAEDSVPKGEIPNKTWTKQLVALNAIQDSSIKLTQAGLWKRQRAKMTVFQGLDPRVEYGEKYSNQFRELFRDNYTDEVRQVWKTLNPMDADGTGIVAYPLASMLRVLGNKSWPVAPPTSDIMWEVMEDLWLLEGLFQSIANVNGGLEAARTDAYLHQIDKLELRGGDGKPSGAPSGVSGGASGSGSGAEGGMFGGMAAPPGGMASRNQAGSEAGGMAGMTTVSAEFDPRDEFGDDGSGAGGGGGVASSMGSMMLGGGGGETTASTAKPVKRYITADDAKLPYKTRGFYLSVKMDHRKIPQLIAELTANEKSVWPVEILRVQMSRLHEDDSSGGSGGGGGSSFASMSSRMTEGYAGAGGIGSSLGSGSGNYESFSPFGAAGPLETGTSAAGNSAQALAARTSFENALKDPYMAQVTICGVFTLYSRVEEAVEVKPASTAPANPDESATPEENGAVAVDEVSGEADDRPAAAAMDADEPAEPVGDPLEKPESPAAKTENDEK